jgi:hypothetical protein
VQTNLRESLSVGAAAGAATAAAAARPLLEFAFPNIIIITTTLQYHNPIKITSWHICNFLTVTQNLKFEYKN